MRLFQWFKSRFEMAPANRAALVTCDDKALEVHFRRGVVVSIPWDDVRRVLIRTTDRGPCDDDVFIVVEASGKNYVIPQPAAGAEPLLAALQQRPGFRNEAVIEGMGCTANRDFVCWERDR